MEIANTFYDVEPLVCIDEVNHIYNETYFKNKAQCIHFENGGTLEGNLGNIQGITDSINSTSSNIAASIKSVNEVSNNLTIHSTTFDNVASHLVGDYVINNESEILYLYKFNTAGVPITNATKVTGGVGVIANADGKAYVMGADSALKKCSGGDYGTFTSSSTYQEFNLGYRPKSVTVRINTTYPGEIFIYDESQSTTNFYIMAILAGSDASAYVSNSLSDTSFLVLTDTGFKVKVSQSDYDGKPSSYIVTG